MRVYDIFTPDQYPQHTYVERGQGKNEKNLKFQLQRPAVIISLSGPSKSGKSMLLNNVVDKLNYNLTTVHGSNINSVSGLWENTLDQLDAPTSTEITKSSGDEEVKRGKAGVDLSIVRGDAGKENIKKESTQKTTSQDRTGLKQIIDSVNLDEFVLYIDDAHYINEDNYKGISEGIKDAYERGMTICVAYIPYRSDDLTKSNPDLSGRIESVTLDYWEEDDLKKIGETGFELLNRYPSELVLKNLARESVGSPHLMQKLCLEICNELAIIETSEEMTPLGAEPKDVENTLKKTADNIHQDYTTVFELLSGNVSQNGDSRKKYQYRLKGEGDIYDILLRALASNPPKLTLGRDEIIERVQDVCRDETPQSGNLVQTIERIDKWVSNKLSEKHYCFDWVDDRKSLEIPDPYLIFCLRWSDMLETNPGLK